MTSSSAEDEEEEIDSWAEDLINDVEYKQAANADVFKDPDDWDQEEFKEYKDRTDGGLYRSTKPSLKPFQHRKYIAVQSTKTMSYQTAAQNAFGFSVRRVMDSIIGEEDKAVSRRRAIAMIGELKQHCEVEVGEPGSDPTPFNIVPQSIVQTDKCHQPLPRLGRSPSSKS